MRLMTHPEPRLTNVLVRVTVNWWNLHLRAWIRALGGALKLTFYSEMNLKEFSSRKLLWTLNRVRGHEVRLNRSSYVEVMVSGNRVTILGRFYIGVLWTSRVHFGTLAFSLSSPPCALSPR